MNNILNRRKENREEGFTLIELVITVAIIGILTAIAVPAFNQIQGWSKVTSFHANNQQLLKSLEMKATQEGVNLELTTADAGFGDMMGDLSRIMNELRSTETGGYGAEDYYTGFTNPVSPEGKVSICAFTYDGTGTNPVGRTDGDPFCKSVSGPNMGYEQFD